MATTIYIDHKFSEIVTGSSVSTVGAHIKNNACLLYTSDAADE